MSRLDRFLIAAWMTVALLSAGASRAMQIREFDKLAGPDQYEYIADLMEGAEKVLVNEGRVDLATQFRNLFATNATGDQASIGRNSTVRNGKVTKIREYIDTQALARASEIIPGAPRA
jgi:hypothetical protein